MTQTINNRFTYDNPPHWANAAITDWQVFNEGRRISVDQLVSKANQQEQHIQKLLAEIQQLKVQASEVATTSAQQSGNYLTISAN